MYLWLKVTKGSVLPEVTLSLGYSQRSVSDMRLSLERNHCWCSISWAVRSIEVQSVCIWVFIINCELRDSVFSNIRSLDILVLLF